MLKHWHHRLQHKYCIKLTSIPFYMATSAWWVHQYLGALYTGRRVLGDHWVIKNWPDFSKAIKKPFLCEILVCPLISQPFLLWGGKIWRSLKDRWEIIGRSLSATWAFVEHSLSVHWATVERSMRDRFPWRSLRLFWTESKLWGDCGDHWDHWTIIDRSGQSLNTLWKIIERSGHFFNVQWSLMDHHLCVKGV